MTDRLREADAQLRAALEMLRAEEQDRIAAFDREMASLRRKIADVETALGRSVGEPNHEDAAQGALLPLWVAPAPRESAPASNTRPPAYWRRKLEGLSQP